MASVGVRFGEGAGGCVAPGGGEGVRVALRVGADAGAIVVVDTGCALGAVPAAARGGADSIDAATAWAATVIRPVDEDGCTNFEGFLKAKGWSF